MNTRIAIPVLMLVALATAFAAVYRGGKGHTEVLGGLPIKFDRVKFVDGKAVLKWQRTGTWEELETTAKKVASEGHLSDPKAKPFDPTRPIRGVQLRVIPRDTFAGTFHNGEVIKILPDTESGSLMFYADNWGTKNDAYFIASVSKLLYDEDLAPPVVEVAPAPRAVTGK